MRAICGPGRPQWPHDIKFSAPSYTSSAVGIGNVVQNLISIKANIANWSQVDNQLGLQCKGVATLHSEDDVNSVIKAFDGYQLPQLAGSAISLSHLVKVKLNTLNAVYGTVAMEIEQTQISLRSETLLEFKVYKGNGPFTTITIVSNSPRSLEWRRSQ